MDRWHEKYLTQYVDTGRRELHLTPDEWSQSQVELPDETRM